MSEQMGSQRTAFQLPATDDKEAWKVYWKAQGQSWRTEPEIDEKRQVYLAERRSIKPNIEQGIYPLKDIKLSRADIEWLLATHENGHGPIEWSYEDQPGGKGLDLRGADLRFVDLHGLPLVSMRGGLSRNEHGYATLEQRHLAKAHLEGANLSSAHLEGANLFRAHLEGADLFRTHLEGVYLKETYLGGASLRSAFLDATTSFTDVILEDKKLGCVWLADIHWGDVNLTRVNWAQIEMLGDENEARRPTRWDGKLKNKDEWVSFYQWAVRANRQLATALQVQGLNEEADHFAYRAQLLQRVVWRYKRRWLKYTFSWLLYLLAGYGYRSLRSVLWYLVFIVGFALAYHLFGHLSLWPPDAFVYSLTSFHGRGFFPGLEHQTSLHDPLLMLAAIEAVVGLLIEISFIATFTQRFFGK